MLEGRGGMVRPWEVVGVEGDEGVEGCGGGRWREVWGAGQEGKG